jgi:hypothetical protein
MKKIILFSLMTFLLTQVSSWNTTYSQDQPPLVNVSVEEVNGQTIYTFVDQRNIPEQNVHRFGQRIANEYSNVAQVTFESSDRKFSIYFTSAPSEEELNTVFSHFNVYNYTLD